MVGLFIELIVESNFPQYFLSFSQFVANDKESNGYRTKSNKLFIKIIN